MPVPFSIFLSKLRASFDRRQADRSLDDELDAHLDLLQADYLRRGLTAGEAATRARRDLGSLQHVKDKHRDHRYFASLESAAQDLRYALRQLRKTPGFTLTTVLTLAIGIGVNAAMFTVIDATILRPVPFADPARLVVLHSPVHLSRRVPYAAIRAWQNRSHIAFAIAYSSQFITTLDEHITTEQLVNVSVSANLFQTLGVQPLLGRTFTAAEQQPGRDRVVLLPEALWRANFHADPRILGSPLKVAGFAYTVVGIMPKGFTYPGDNQESSELWTPLALTHQVLDEDYELEPVVRLRPGATPDDLARELNILGAQLHKEDSHHSYPLDLEATPYRESLNSNIRPSLLALDAAVVLVWLIACANVAGLMFSRLNTRRRELSIRNALGAGRGRLIRQLLTESLLISTAGTLGGLALSQLALKLLAATVEQRFPTATALHPSPTVLLALVLTTFLSALIFGVVPALHASASAPAEGLTENSSRTGASRRQNRARDLFVIGEIALSVILLVSAGLMIRTLYAIRQVPLGFTTERILGTSIFIPAHQYDDRDTNRAFYTPLLDRVRSQPGIEDAALSSVLPLQSGFSATASFELVGRPKPTPQNQPIASFRVTTPNFPSLLHIRLLSGRFLNAADVPGAPVVALVNQTFARKYFAGANPLGAKMRLAEKGPFAETTIVGVLEDVHQTTLNAPPAPEINFSLNQITPTDDLYTVTTMFMQLVVRTHVPPQSIVPEIRSAVHSLNPALAVENVQTLQELVDSSFTNQALAARLLGLFAAIALLIAAGGLYALLAYSVSQRTHELGIRIALGAKRAEVYKLVLRHATWITCLGIAFGTIAVWFAARLLRAYLFGIAEDDAITLALVICTLLAVGMLAAFLPARRAASVDPMVALRHE